VNQGCPTSLFRGRYIVATYSTIHSATKKVAERKNISLKEMATCMFHARSLPSNIWVGHLTVLTTFIMNLLTYFSRIGLPLRHGETTNWKSPTSEYLDHAWAHVPSEKRKALYPQRTACIFVGYPNGVKGYMLIDPSMKISLLSEVSSLRKVPCMHHWSHMQRPLHFCPTPEHQR
jgi:hypothetical protein